MKKALTICVALFSAVIIFFSLFGERIYYATKPHVKEYRVTASTSMDSGETYMLVPKSCVSEDGKVYILSSQAGFSLTISTVTEREVVTEPFDWDKSLLIAISGVSHGDVLASNPDRELKDGARVVITGREF